MRVAWYFVTVILFAFALLVLLGVALDGSVAPRAFTLLASMGAVSFLLAFIARARLGPHHMVVPCLIVGAIFIINASIDEFAGASGVPRKGEWEISFPVARALPSRPFDAARLVADKYSEATGVSWKVVGLQAVVESGVITSWGVDLLHYDYLMQRWYAEVGLDSHASASELICYSASRSPNVVENRWLALSNMESFLEPNKVIDPSLSGTGIVTYADDAPPMSKSLR